MSNHLVGTIIDRFGKDAFIVPDDSDHFVVQVDVNVSPQFFAWISGFGAAAAIIGPSEVVEKMREHSKAVYSQYEG